MLSQQHHTSTMDQQQRRQSRPTGPRLAMFEETQLPQRPTTAPMTQGHSFVPLAMGVQDGRMVGITNQGQIQQHYLQVAQQQRQALPGQQQHPNLAVPLTAEQYRTFRHSQLDAELNSVFQGNQMSPQRGMPTSAQAFQGLGISSMMPADSAIGMPGYGYLNPMAITSPKRKPMPLTPPMQTNNFFPTTPEETPFCRVIDFSPIRAPLELPKQIDGRRESDAQQASSGLQIIVTEPTKDSEELAQINKAESNVSLLPSPPNTAPIPTTRTFDAFIPGPPLHGGPGPALRVGGSIDATPFDLFTELVDIDADTSPVASPQLSSAAHSPTTMTMDYSPIANMNMSIQPPVMDLTHSFQLFNNGTTANFGPWDATPRPDSSPRSNSLTDMDAIVEETGISAEEVQAYIEEPDVARGGKWKCLYPGCEKLFGRKENIRSHVQTHLGDRQYKCLHCNKCFVRQHDLKRHSKIHSGVKPYPCRCGNTFARHDALTRHRQRGICDGGLPGVVKKPVKRGRPRKERPNNEDRADKAARTRLHAAERSGSESAESDEEMGSPISSAHGSPTQGSHTQGSPLMYDNLDMSPLQQENLETFQEQPLSFDPAVFSTTPPMSDYSTGATPPDRASVSDTTLTPHDLGLSLEQDAGLGVTASDIALFPSSENNIMIENTPELTLGSPSTGMTDMDFNNSNFNSSELSQSMTFQDLPSADTLGLFDASQLLEGGMQDPSWDANFLDFSNADNDKSLHMFDDQVVFADTP